MQELQTGLRRYQTPYSESSQIYYHEYKKLYEHSLLLSKQLS
jgi:hypothetical protein